MKKHIISRISTSPDWDNIPAIDLEYMNWTPFIDITTNVRICCDDTALYLRFEAKEAEIRAILSQMPKAQEIEAMLSAVGLEKQAFYQLYSHEKIADAISYAKELKDRYSVLWLYHHLFGPYTGRPTETV